MVSRRQKLVRGALIGGVVTVFAAMALTQRSGVVETAHQFLGVQGCNLHEGACRADSGEGASIELAISPREIPLLERLDVSVALEGIEASAVEVVFTGVDVDMGTLAYPLESSPGGRYSGWASLSVCSQSRMTWKATVVVEAEGVKYEVPFLFDTEYRSKFNFI